MVELFMPKLEEIKIVIDGDKVALVTQNATIRIPWQVAMTLAKAIVTQAGKIEEMANVHRVVNDQAFFLRAGIPIGLSNNPDIRQEAMHEAQYNDRLRKELPGGVKSKTMFGTPKIIKHKPRR